MAELSDETLMAYADNELDPVERVQVEKILAGRPELAARLGLFERTRQPVQEAFEALLKERVPKELVDRVRGITAAPESPAKVATQRGLRIVASGNTVRGAGFPQRGLPSWTPLALAASLCLVIGGAAGWYSRTPGAADSTRMEPGLRDTTGTRAEGVLQLALETGSSGTAVGVPAGSSNSVRVKPVATFRSRDQRYCRQYELTSGDLAMFDGVACRTAEGVWEILFHAQAPKRSAPSGQIVPAAPSAPSAIDAAVDRVLDGGIFDPSEEKRSIIGRWTS